MSGSGEARAREGYIPGLDGIRAVACLLVICAHALPGWSFYIPATLGVTIFFFLSGYLITTLLRRELEASGTVRLGRFYLRRALRIVVPLWVVYALAAAVAHWGLHASAGNWLGFSSMLFYVYNYTVAMGLPAWLPHGMNVIWSLSVEEHFYLLFPAVLLWAMRDGSAGLSGRLEARSRRLRWGIVTFCAAELVWRILLTTVLHQHNFWTYYATDARLDSILFGCLLALEPEPASADEGSRSTGRSGWMFAAALALLVMSLAPRNYYYRETLRYTVQGCALYAIFRHVVAGTGRWYLAWLEWLPLRYLGWISYVVYLSHEFILDALVARWPERLWLTAPLGLGIAVVFATAMRYALELPLQRLRARL